MRLNMPISRVVRGALGLLFLLPWVIFERIAESHNWLAGGYLVGLICGMLTGACFSAKPPKWWQMALVGAVLIVVRIWSIYPF
jgi:hypothetical protein